MVILTIHNADGIGGKPLEDATSKEVDCHEASRKPSDAKLKDQNGYCIVSKNR